MAISFVAATGYSSNSSSSSVTINKPTGTTNGDYMVAIVAVDTFNSAGGDVTVTPPSGWTSQAHIRNANCVIDVMTRTAGSSEPTSWTATLGGAEYPRASCTSTYRGVVGLAIDGNASLGAGTSYSTATVNNPTATNWRVVAAAYVSSSVSYALASNETSKRDSRSNTTLETAIFDSNATIATGNTSRTVSRSSTWESSCGWIGILDAVDGAAVDGTLAATLPKLSMTSAADISYSATLAVALPQLSMTSDGIASPPSGPLDAMVTPVMAVAAFEDASGALSVMPGPVVSLVAETRAFGIRVITPEHEDRTIVPRLGADTASVAELAKLKGRVTQEVGGDLIRVQLPLLVGYMEGFGNRGPDSEGSFGITLPMPTMNATAKKVNIMYAVDIGNGSLTSFTVTHNLNSRDVLTAVYETASPYEEVQPTSIERTTVNTVTVTFPVAPTTNQYRVVVVYG